jgi:hypothetical protein
VFMGKQNAIQLLGIDCALLEPQGDLPRAQPSIDQNLAVIGREQRAISRAPAPEHGQTEHDPYLATGLQFSQIKLLGDEFGSARIRSFLAE